MASSESGPEQSQPSAEQRRELRLPVDSLVMPFLGSLESNHQSFQYVILDISVHGARISLPNWVISRERLLAGETVNLHLPFRLGREVFDQGVVAWNRWDEALQAQSCGLRLLQAAPHFQTVFFDLSGDQVTLDLQNFASPQGLATRVLKDSHLLKRGILIYLNHLIPYFSRVGDYPRQDFQALKQVFLVDLQAQVRGHQQRLEALYRQLVAGEKDEEEVLLDLETLRGLSESELPQEILATTFTSPLAAQQIAAIKTLETRLYANYNTLVMLYLRVFAGR